MVRADGQGTLPTPGASLWHAATVCVWGVPLRYAPHPPISILDPTAVAIPSGSDFYGGINDRHAVVNRSAAEAFVPRWATILDGTILQVDAQLRSGDVLDTMRLNGEWLVRNTLVHHRLPLQRFKNTAALTCCASRCSQPTCHTAALPDPEAVLRYCRAGHAKNESAVSSATAPTAHAASLIGGAIAWPRTDVRLVRGECRGAPHASTAAPTPALIPLRPQTTPSDCAVPLAGGAQAPWHPSPRRPRAPMSARSSAPILCASRLSRVLSPRKAL